MIVIVSQLWEDAVYDNLKQPTNPSPALNYVTLQMWRKEAFSRVFNLTRHGYKVGAKTKLILRIKTTRKGGTIFVLLFDDKYSVF